MDQQGGPSYGQSQYGAGTSSSPLGQTQYNPGTYGTPPGMAYPGSQGANIDVLGILWIVYGAIGLVFGIGYAVFVGGMGAIAGSTSARPDDATAAGIMVVVALVVAIASAVFSIPCILAGIGLRRRAGWARIVAIVMAALSVFSIPFGTAIAIYSFILLMKPEVAAEFS